MMITRVGRIKVGWSVAKSSKESKASAKVENKVEIPQLLTVQELANLLGIGGVEVVKQLMQNGVVANLNQPIDFDTAAQPGTG